MINIRYAQVTIYRDTALHLACYAGRLSVVEVLLVVLVLVMVNHQHYQDHQKQPSSTNTNN